jgi:hypothetical protein
VKGLVAAIVGSLVSVHALAITAPGVRDEAVQSRSLAGAAAPLSSIDSRMYVPRASVLGSESSSFGTPMGYWTPRLANYNYSSLGSGAGAFGGWGGMMPVPGGAQPMWTAGGSTFAYPGGGLGSLGLGLASSWFNPLASISPWFASVMPYSFDSTYNFLFGSVRETGSLTRPANGVLSYTFTQTITLNEGLPAPVTQVPEGGGLALLAAGLGVMALAQRRRRARGA